MVYFPTELATLPCCFSCPLPLNLIFLLSGLSPASFVAAGVSQKWLILKDTVLAHLKSVDGATSGFHHIGPRGDSTNNLFGGLDIREIVKNPEAWESGFGYEEMQGVFPHAPNQYDSDGFAKQPERLKEFIRKNMFLSKDLFDYDKLKYRFIG